MRLSSAFLLLSMLLSSAAAWAARPMVTDDARTVDAKACQLESWAKFNRKSHELWALPACNFTGNLEVTLGGGVMYGREGRTTDTVLQGKTLFRPLGADQPGIGWAFGTVRHPAIHTGNNALGDYYTYFPVSMAFLDERLVVHTNLGWLRAQEDVHTRKTWGVGTETRLSGRDWLIAETYGQTAVADTSSKSYFQLGIRHWIVTDRVQLDATWGERIGHIGQERWFTLGLRLLSAPFLP